MAMAPELFATLQSVAGAMAPFTDGWWIIGSAAVAPHGLDAGPVHDVDVLIEARLVDVVFERLGVEPMALPPDPLFHSTTFARWEVTPVPVEVMAGFHVAEAKQWRPVEPRSRQRVVIEGGVLFVPERQELLALLRLFGRLKDVPRIQALQSAEAAAQPAAPPR